MNLFIYCLSVLSLILPLSTRADNNQTVIVYSILTDYANQLGQEFRKETGIKVQAIHMRGSGIALARIQSEAPQPRGDVWFCGSLGAHAQGAYEGLLEPYRPTAYELLSPQFRDPLGANRVTGLYTGILGLLVNVDYLKKKSLPVPSSWEDLTEPRYRGMISIRTPLTSGTAYTTLITLVKLLGEDKAFRYQRHFYNGASEFTKRQTEQVVAGHKGIGIMFAHDAMDAIQAFKNLNVNLNFVIPKEGTGFEIGGLSLIKNGPNPQAAKQFINFAVSKRGQEILALHGYRYPVHRQVKINSGALKLQDVPLVDIDFKWAGQQRQRLLQRWQREIHITRD
ncbi:MAG: ABC transporter substrate-binding protein [Pseudomonadales bacterium]